ncbi:hypothetical protein BRADI_3g57492v3 [Brachypodium distachyon]|uniref:WRC domain-containing protein n=1 Tax=Brachypodium distachyon TaxID=15368 RepID=A0A0Q3MBK6_BRADI|nr:hypothetical protein BRADI_3g57492v3 [Brachypodium distachyon]
MARIRGRLRERLPVCLCRRCNPGDLVLALRSIAPQGHVVPSCELQLIYSRGVARRQAAAAAADDGDASLQNGHAGENNPEHGPLMVVNSENPLLNEVVPAAMPPAPTEAVMEIAVKKKRAGQAVPASGSSRCTRSNGKKWRCEERTQGTTYLCDHHLDQSRERSARCASKRAAAAALAVAPAEPEAEV